LEIGHLAETGGERSEGYAEESRGEGAGEGDDLRRMFFSSVTLASSLNFSLPPSVSEFDEESGAGRSGGKGRKGRRKTHHDPDKRNE